MTAKHFRFFPKRTAGKSQAQILSETFSDVSKRFSDVSKKVTKDFRTIENRESTRSEKLAKRLFQSRMIPKSVINEHSVVDVV